LLLVDPAASPTCQQASARRNPVLLISAFRAARLRGHGAEGCLTAEALSHYDDAHCGETALVSSPGPLVLYRCLSHRLVASPDDVNEAERSDPHHIQLVVHLSGLSSLGHPIDLSEHLEVGSGVPVGGESRVNQVITDVYGTRSMRRSSGPSATLPTMPQRSTPSTSAWPRPTTWLPRSWTRG
jgi:hypothetical protein